MSDKKDRSGYNARQHQGRDKRHETKRFRLCGIDHFPNINAHRGIDHVYFVHQRNRVTSISRLKAPLASKSKSTVAIPLSLLYSFVKGRLNVDVCVAVGVAVAVTVAVGVGLTVGVGVGPPVTKWCGYGYS